MRNIIENSEKFHLLSKMIRTFKFLFTKRKEMTMEDVVFEKNSFKCISTAILVRITLHQEKISEEVFRYLAEKKDKEIIFDLLKILPKNLIEERKKLIALILDVPSVNVLNRILLMPTNSEILRKFTLTYFKELISKRQPELAL